MRCHRFSRALLSVLALATAAGPVFAELPQGTLSGNVVVQLDAKNRIAILLDAALRTSAAAPSGPDGRVDYVFLFFATDPGSAARFLRATPTAASVRVADGTLVLQLADSKETLRLVTRGNQAGAPTEAKAEIQMTGVELVSNAWISPPWLLGSEGDRDFSRIRLDRFPSVADRLTAGRTGRTPSQNGQMQSGSDDVATTQNAPAMMGECNAGGVGSKACEKNCNKLFSVVTWSCKVECNEGYYACCNCEDGCQCILDHQEMWPLPPDPPKE